MKDPSNPAVTHPDVIFFFPQGWRCADVDHWAWAREWLPKNRDGEVLVSVDQMAEIWSGLFGGCRPGGLRHFLALHFA